MTAEEEVDAVRAFMVWIAGVPELLPEAPSPLTLQEMEDRIMREHHLCLRCGVPADGVFVTGSPIGPRWLDMCARCGWLVHQAAEG